MRQSRSVGEHHVALVPRARRHARWDAAGAAGASRILIRQYVSVVCIVSSALAASWSLQAATRGARGVCVVPWRRGVVAAPGHRAVTLFSFLSTVTAFVLVPVERTVMAPAPWAV